jgi:hypothetical protein
MAWAAEDEDEGRDKRTQDKASGKEGHGRSEGGCDEKRIGRGEGAAGLLERGECEPVPACWWS